MITQVYDPNSYDAGSENFAFEFQMRHSAEATAFDAEVYDAVQFVARATRDAAGGTPQVMRAAALRLRRAGACGPMHVTPEGTVVREVSLWQVDGGGFLYQTGSLAPGGW